MPDPASRPDLAAIRERCEAAGPAPWHACYNIHGDPTVSGDPDREPFLRVAQISTAPPDYGRGNCEFIAAARSDIPALLSLVDRLEAELDEKNAVIAAVEALHYEAPIFADAMGGESQEAFRAGDEPSWYACATCNGEWPCRTALALAPTDTKDRK